jgi:hypothetical protein
MVIDGIGLHNTDGFLLWALASPSGLLRWGHYLKLGSKGVGKIWGSLWRLRDMLLIVSSKSSWVWGAIPKARSKLKRVSGVTGKQRGL